MKFKAKLTATQKEEVLLHYEMGRPLKEIACDFGLHPEYIRVLARRNNISWVNRKTNWKSYCVETDDRICEIDLTNTPILRSLLTSPAPGGDGKE